MPGFPRFNQRWASGGTAIDPSGAQADAGFAYLGPTPPSVEMFNAIHQWNDEKDNWLFNQIERVIIDGLAVPADENDLDQLLNAINAKIAAGVGALPLPYVRLAGDTMSGPLAISANNDPLFLTSAANQSCQISATVTGIRHWTFGALADGTFVIADQTTVAQRVLIDGVGQMTIGGDVAAIGSIESGGRLYSRSDLIVDNGGRVAGGFNADLIDCSSFGVSYSGVGGTEHFGFARTPEAALLIYYNGVSTSQVILSNTQEQDMFPIKWMMLRAPASAVEAYLSGGGFVSWPITLYPFLITDVKPATIDALNIIEQLQIYESTQTSSLIGAVSQHWDCSLIADEVAPLIPAAYVPGKEAGYETLKELPLICTLIKAIQQLSERVTAGGL